MTSAAPVNRAVLFYFSFEAEVGEGNLIFGALPGDDRPRGLLVACGRMLTLQLFILSWGGLNRGLCKILSIGLNKLH